MDCLDIFRMIISPSSTHSFRVPVVRYDVAAVSKFLVTDCAFFVLLHDFAINQLSHLSWRPQFPVSSGVMRIFDSLNAKP
jgi:hypothetical protein